MGFFRDRREPVQPAKPDNIILDLNPVQSEALIYRGRRFKYEVEFLQTEINFETKKAVNSGLMCARINKHERVLPETVDQTISFLQTKGYEARVAHRSDCNCNSHIEWSWKPKAALEAPKKEDVIEPEVVS